MLSEFHVSGRAGDHLHGGVHHGDVHQDPGAGLHAAQGQLHEEPLELHGLLCRDLRVGNSRNYMDVAAADFDIVDIICLISRECDYTRHYICSAMLTLILENRLHKSCSFKHGQSFPSCERLTFEV